MTFLREDFFRSLQPDITQTYVFCFVRFCLALRIYLKDLINVVLLGLCRSCFYRAEQIRWKTSFEESDVSQAGALHGALSGHVSPGTGCFCFECTHGSLWVTPLGGSFTWFCLSLLPQWLNFKLFFGWVFPLR